MKKSFERTALKELKQENYLSASNKNHSKNRFNESKDSINQSFKEKE
jgi:hypothetical protein